MLRGNLSAASLEKLDGTLRQQIPLINWRRTGANMTLTKIMNI